MLARGAPRHESAQGVDSLVVALFTAEAARLVSLARFQTVGSLMGNLVGGRMAIEGRIARFVYVSLYRLHILAIHGRLGGLSMIALRPASRALRPRLKLH